MALANQKTFLQIQQEISEVCLKTTYPNTAQDGKTTPGLTRLNQIINDAYSEICTEVDWQWRFKDTYSFNTVEGQQLYTMPDECADIIDMLIPLFQQRLRTLVYSQWITNYPGKYTNYANTKPWAYIQAPYAQVGGPGSPNALQIYLFPAADASPAAGYYSVNVAYMVRPTNLVNPTDVLICPPEFQDMVINRAIYKMFKYLKDKTWEEYDDSSQSTPCGLRYSKLWIANTRFAEQVAYWRNIRNEVAFTSSFDINRVLFGYGG